MMDTTASPIVLISSPMLSMIGLTSESSPWKAAMISGSFSTVVVTMFVISGIYGAMASTIFVMQSDIVDTIGWNAVMISGSFVTVVSTIRVIHGM